MSYLSTSFIHITSQVSVEAGKFFHVSLDSSVVGKVFRTLSWCYFLLGHERQTGRRKNSPRWQCWTAVDKAPTLSRLFKSVNLEPCKNSMIWKFKQGTQTVKTQQKCKLRNMQEPCLLMWIYEFLILSSTKVLTPEKDALFVLSVVFQFAPGKMIKLYLPQNWDKNQNLTLSLDFVCSSQSHPWAP